MTTPSALPENRYCSQSSWCSCLLHPKPKLQSKATRPSPLPRREIEHRQSHRERRSPPRYRDCQHRRVYPPRVHQPLSPPQTPRSEKANTARTSSYTPPRLCHSPAHGTRGRAPSTLDPYDAKTSTGSSPARQQKEARALQGLLSRQSRGDHGTGGFHSCPLPYFLHAAVRVASGKRKAQQSYSRK